MSSSKAVNRRRSREAAFNVLFCHHFTGSPVPTAVTAVEATEVVEAMRGAQARLTELMAAAEIAVKALQKSFGAISEAMSEEGRGKRTEGEGVLKARRWVVETRGEAIRALAEALSLARRTDGMFDDEAFTSRLLDKFENNRDQVDLILQRSLKGWSHERLTPADGSLLRLGITELLFFEDVPTKVVVNEYIDLAHRFGGDEGHKLVNAVLDRVMRDHPRKPAAPKSA